ncbi:MAG: enoyl-CoA hydratase [Candidatus Poriferisodalaceae bacterium]|jgi:enoyl-CoA hydratase
MNDRDPNHDFSGNSVVLVDVVDRIGTITMNRPEARNALSSELLGLLPRAVSMLEANTDVDVMILTGTDPAFSAGLDLRELGSSDGNINPGSGDTSPRAQRGAFPAHTKPLIGAVNGVAVTGGFELAVCCDFLIASEHARFADTHARVGVMPGWGLTVLLPQAIGVSRSRELSLTGNFLDAPTAYEWGLVNRVVPHAELMSTTRQIASDIISNDQPGVREVLGTYALTSEATVGEAWEIEATRGRDWLRRSSFTKDQVAERRAAIQERGRSQAR